MSGVSALVFYLAAYALMNLAAFAVITIRERETPFGDDIRSVEGLGARAAGAGGGADVSMLALAGLPGTAGFIGKLYLIEATVEADYTWLGVMIAVGTMISLAYYLRVIAAIWMRPGAGAAAPGGDAGDRRRLPGGRRRGHRRQLQGDPRAHLPRRRGDRLLRRSSPRRWSTGRPPPARRSARWRANARRRYFRAPRLLDSLRALARHRRRGDSIPSRARLFHNSIEGWHP